MPFLDIKSQTRQGAGDREALEEVPITLNPSNGRRHRHVLKHHQSCSAMLSSHASRESSSRKLTGSHQIMWKMVFSAVVVELSVI